MTKPIAPASPSPSRGDGNAQSREDPASVAPQQEATRKLANPLDGCTPSELLEMGRQYCDDHGFVDSEDVRAFRLGAVLAAHPDQSESLDELTEKERDAIAKESSSKWRSISSPLWCVAIICSLCAAVQGMDEATVNGAQTIYKTAFGIEGHSNVQRFRLGLTNGAPYLCCAVLGCWLTRPLNSWLGRRGTIFLSCAVSAIACLGQAFTNSWQAMFLVRLCLGLGIGPKSATTPMYAAECAPQNVRGALVMQWQMWTAFGIMLGFLVDLAFFTMENEDLKWRLMLASTTLPALVVCACCYLCPESPRHYLVKGEHLKAYAAMSKLRIVKVQAARDLFYANALLKAEREAAAANNKNFLQDIRDLFVRRRNRNALVASEIVMFMQQFCGVNIIAYYSAEIFIANGFDPMVAFGISLGWGVVNWLGAIPAVFTIDSFGRRNLLLVTFPLMAICLLFTGWCFSVPDESLRIPLVATGAYLFALVYSPGAGPVPFTYSAEVYPLDVRPVGMSIATATTWLFNFILALTFPLLRDSFTSQGAFSWYAGWNVAGFFLTLFFVPETKQRTLEELDGVFDVRSRELQKYGWQQLCWLGRRATGRNATMPQQPYHQTVLEMRPMEPKNDVAPRQVS